MRYVRAQCLGCHFAGVAPRAIRGAWPRGTSRACGSSLRSCSSRGQRTSAGVAPQAIRGAWPRGTSRACGSSLRSCSSRGQRTSAGVAPRAIRGAWPRGTSRALGSSLSLVLIERPAHVRGGCTPGNSRRVTARDKSRLWQLAIARAHRIASARARRGRCVVPPLLGCVTEKALFA